VTSTITTTAILTRSPGEAGDCSKKAEAEEVVEEDEGDEEEGELEGDDVDGVWKRELLSVEDDCAALVGVKVAIVPLSLEELADEVVLPCCNCVDEI
jgi:hypothetical protein